MTNEAKVGATEEGNLVRLEIVPKAAFVGDPRWKDDVFAFVAKPFRTIPMEYFPTEAAARAWLAA